MFYPVDSLKRGGRFYLCWVADSWPLRFAAITHRQLWSQDIRQLCDDLLEVMTNESGRPINRFSLRLSSQLMRGLVRLYERKVTVFLGDLCMINAQVFKHANKKCLKHERIIFVEQRLQNLAQLPPAPEEPDNEPRVEEMIQNSGNVVSNIQDITLKEATIPDFQLPPNDGFGEENPEQTLQQLLGDRTVEMMMQQPEPAAAQLSALGLAADGSRDHSRLALDTPQMERLSDLDVTMFRKSTAEVLLLPGEFDKDIPEIPHPELPAPPEKQVEEQEPLEVPPLPQDVVEQANNQDKEIVDIELEELEVDANTKKRRGKNTRLVVDKRVKLSGGYIRARIDNVAVELRCEDSSEDIIDVRVPWAEYSRRPAHAGAGAGAGAGLARALTRMFQRNLALVPPRAHADPEEVRADRPQCHTRSTLERIEEEVQPQLEPNVQVSREIDVVGLDTTARDVTGPRVPRISVEPMDISDLPTQKLETLSQARKRTSEFETSPKRARLSGYVAFRESQQRAATQQIQVEISHSVINDKENIPPEPENLPPSPHKSPKAVRNVSTMLQEAGLADFQPAPEPAPVESQTRTRRDQSESSETPLGSLDRTKVSLGDSVRTTDSQRFIRNQWGIEGTMVKILSCVKAGARPLRVESLVARGPLLPGLTRVIAARCFTSILKLKQHAFIKIEKDPDTLEIRDITLGPKFDGIE